MQGHLNIKLTKISSKYKIKHYIIGTGSIPIFRLKLKLRPTEFVATDTDTSKVCVLFQPEDGDISCPPPKK